MTRSQALLALLGNGRDYDAPRLAGLAAEFDLPLADVLVVGGHPVPGELLPPERDAEVMRAFVYRATHCDHEQLAALTEFLAAMPDEAVSPPARAAADGFPAVLAGLMGNRGRAERCRPVPGSAGPSGCRPGPARKRAGTNSNRCSSPAGPRPRPRTHLAAHRHERVDGRPGPGRALTALRAQADASVSSLLDVIALVSGPGLRRSRTGG